MLALCILSACNTAYDEPDATASGESEMLTLTVSVSDIVESNDPSTRSEESADNGITTFQADDRVGLIVLDKAGNLLVDNVPYRYDGHNWNFVGDVDKQPYYDAAMWDYIVYYPYKKEVDGCRNIDDIKSKEVFEPQEDQTSEDKYQKADILMWTPEEKGPIRKIEAAMKHVYDSFSFRIDIKWKLDPIKEEITYQPMQETLKDFKIEFIPDENHSNTITLFDSEDESNNRIYLDNDGYYRYLMSRGQKGTISWHYTYRYITFRGERTINTNYSGRRYVNYETADMGELPGPNMQVSDFYCSRGNTGYVFPWDAAFPIDETNEYEKIPFANHHCIGLIIRLGQHINDISDYSKILEGKICHGYVMALTDTPDEVEWANTGNPGAKAYVGVNLYIPSSSKALVDWCGFYNNKVIKAYAEKTANITLQDFPAAYACETYGDGYGLSAPGNTTGWFLPSIGMNLSLLKDPTEIIETTGLKYEKEKLLKERLETIIDYIKYDLSYQADYAYVGAIGVCSSQSSYWSSNESSSTKPTNALVTSTSKAVAEQDKTAAGTIKIRPFLVF